MNPYALAVAAVLAVAALLAVVRWLRVPAEHGAVPALLAAFLLVGIALDVALGAAAFIADHVVLRYRMVYAGLVLGPLIFTAGYTAAMSRRYRHAPQGAALLWLGALCGILLFLVISRGRT